MALELDDDLEALARRLARQTGESVRQAVRRSLAERLSRLSADGGETDILAARVPSGPAFEVRLFGHPVIFRRASNGERHEVSWRLRRSMAVLVYLALAPGHRASKDELVESLWRGEGPDAIQRNFHPTVSDARRSLATDARAEEGDIPTIAHRDGVYVLDPAIRWWIDVDVFRRLVHAAEEAEEPAIELRLLESAWRLVHAPLVRGFDADWVAGPRDELHRAWLAALRRIGELASQLGRHELALDAWRRLLMEEPFEEQAHLEVMELYGRAGRRDLVRRQYVKLQELLTELDVEPAPKTQERYLDLMR
ncbi:MAG: type II toxin-antitoxin system VapB family antitoxin [Thermoanaerobaculia bacterium]|nr:type II toxin-antitoxin system VapB family antitoxin [Thermoanaerobaculia bacterium]